jgi:hypothetical protein
MKRLSFLIVFCFWAATAVAEDRAAATTSATQSEIPPLPAQLSGRWYYAAGPRWSNTWEVKQISNGSGLLTWWAIQSGCSFQNVPVDIEYDGDVLKVAMNKEQLAKTPCSFKFVATLKRNSNKFEGDIEHRISGAGGTVFHATVE